MVGVLPAMTFQLFGQTRACRPSPTKGTLFLGGFCPIRVMFEKEALFRSAAQWRTMHVYTSGGRESLNIHQRVREPNKKPYPVFDVLGSWATRSFGERPLLRTKRRVACMKAQMLATGSIQLIACLQIIQLRNHYTHMNILCS